jgi:hypothetical protein
MTDRTHDNAPNVASPNVDAKVDLIPTSVVSMRIISCPEMTVPDVEHNVTRKQSLCVHRILCKKSSSVAS